MVKTTSHRIGPVTVGVCGTHVLADLIREELGKNSGTQIDNCNILFHFKAGEFEEQFEAQYYCGGNFIFNSTDMQVTENGYKYYTEGLFSDKTTHVFVSVSSQSFPRKIVELVRQFSSPSNLGGLNKIKTRFASYTTLWPLIHFELLQTGCAFIHASVVDDGSSGTVITGTGGSGKTSTAFELLTDPEHTYLAEDFGIVSVEGTSFYSPRFATIYRSDYIHGQPDLVRYVETELSGLDKAHWRIHAAMGGDPKRKVLPEQILGEENLLNETNIEYAFYIVRTETDSITIDTINTDEFVERAARASLRELKRLYDLLCQAEATGDDTVQLPSIDTVLEQTKEVYTSCFEDVNTYVIHASPSCSPKNITREIEYLKRK